MRQLILLIVATVCLLGCHRPIQVAECTTEAIAVNAAADELQDSAYIQSLAPLKKELEREMSVQLGYAPERMWVGAPECPMLNWATDALWNAAQKACPHMVDMAVVNMGSMREWQKGPVTKQNVFELMPYDNRLVVLTLTGKDILDLCQSFATYGAQGVAGLRMTAVDGRPANVTIGGKPVRADATYTIATSDYLAGGTDHMDALRRYTERWNSDILIRDLYMNAVKSQDTIRAVVDGRMNLL
ncbi:MAG: 5'-nucleotidase C-terminal domain-containing protein [Paludibacteraceae bacterium]|nr:5'-nucleotidase C-terminal domain-containing protein [Paludibacteraceae bacterium]